MKSLQRMRKSQMNLDKIIRESESIGIAGHIHPDGDCVGSSLGLYNYVLENYPDKRVVVLLEEIPEVFDFFSGADKIIDPNYYEGEPFDTFFAVDCSDTLRLGKAFDYFKSSKKTICIDHHISNLSFAMENYIIPDASSTSELVCSLMDPDRISKNTAECLYTGIVHDTGVFQYSCTKSETMKLAGMLMDKGIDYPRIIEYTFYEKTFVQNRLLGRALLNSKLFDDGKIIATVLKKSDFSEFGAKKSDTEGIVNQLRVTKGCDVAIFLYQNEDGTYKASLRATGNINVADIAVSYGGGGHEKAAGCTVGKEPWKEIEKIVSKVVSLRK